MSFITQVSTHKFLTARFDCAKEFVIRKSGYPCWSQNIPDKTLPLGLKAVSAIGSVSGLHEEEKNPCAQCILFDSNPISLKTPF